MAIALTLARRLAPERRFLESSAILFVGTSIARVLGFLFSVASARFLLPADYGVLAYALGVIGIASALPYTAPTTLARYLAAHHSRSTEQDWYFSNWLAIVGLLVALSAAVALPFVALSGLPPGMVAAILLNLLGAAVLEGYMGAARGLEAYARAAGFYVVANAIQLVVILALSLAGRQSSLSFLLVYGVSSSIAVLMMQSVAPLQLAFRRGLVSRAPMLDIFKFMVPLLIQTVFYAGWFGADILFLRRFESEEALGTYAAAKVIMTVLILAPTAIGGVQLSRIARVPAHQVPQTVIRAVALTAAATLPSTLFLALFGGFIGSHLYGGKYPLIGAPIPLLALGTGLYCFGVRLF
jgi:O-antigen/teichoic acid export membrane protein